IGQINDVNAPPGRGLAFVSDIGHDIGRGLCFSLTFHSFHVCSHDGLLL
ncbi:unnamed protein product, partial [Rotaria sordida]